MGGLTLARAGKSGMGENPVPLFLSYWISARRFVGSDHTAYAVTSKGVYRTSHADPFSLTNGLCENLLNSTTPA